MAVLDHVHDAGHLAPRYAFMIVMSCGIATLGLLQNSAAVIIGAMLISPLMGPIIGLGIGLATVRSHVEVIYKQHHVRSRGELIRMLRPKELATDGARMDTDEKKAVEPQITPIAQMKESAA